MGLSAREAVIRKPWLLPFIAALARGAESVREVADTLGCSRRLASTGLYAVERLGVDVDGVDFCIVRWRSWFVARIGSVYVAAKVGKRRVKAYTVPSLLLSKAEVGGKLGYRAGVVRLVLERGVNYVGCEGKKGASGDS